jgi:hypothetical protein
MKKYLLLVLSLFTIGCSSMSPTSPSQSADPTVSPKTVTPDTMLWDSTKENAPKAIIWGW